MPRSDDGIEPSDIRVRTDAERIEMLESQVRVLFAMVRCVGRGLRSVMECFGIDPAAACADLEGETR